MVAFVVVVVVVVGGGGGGGGAGCCSYVGSGSVEAEDDKSEERLPVEMTDEPDMVLVAVDDDDADADDAMDTALLEAHEGAGDAQRLAGRGSVCCALVILSLSWAVCVTAVATAAALSLDDDEDDEVS